MKYYLVILYLTNLCGEPASTKIAEYATIGLAIYCYGAVDESGLRPSAKPFLGMSQRQIAATLGFPDTDGSVRILAKIMPERFDAARYELLFPALRSDAVSQLMDEFESIDDDLLAYFCDPIIGPRLTRSLLREVAQKRLPSWLCNVREELEAELSWMPESFGSHRPTLEDIPLDEGEIDEERATATGQIWALIVDVADLEARVSELDPEFEPNASFESLRSILAYYDSLAGRLGEPGHWLNAG